MNLAGHRAWNIRSILRQFAVDPEMCSLLVITIGMPLIISSTNLDDSDSLGNRAMSCHCSTSFDISNAPFLGFVRGLSLMRTRWI